MSKKNYIFDSLAHPTLDANWVSKDLDASFESLQLSMKDSSVKWACAIGMETIGGYTHKMFIDKCRNYDNLYPIAGFNPVNSNIIEELQSIKELGYHGIKIHPRLSKVTLANQSMEDTFEACAELELTIFLCTYYYDNTIDMQYNNFENLVGLVNANLNTKVVLVHGGSVELLKHMELTRFNQNILLDLSLTIMKYKGSSVDMDIDFLFKHFDRRICIGTDHPEYTQSDLEERFNYFSKDLSEDKKHNIASLNLANFLGVNLET
jgi:predicted TIM-barrel fold metal-dependent hydrolase